MPSPHNVRAKWRAQGRRALESYLYIRPYDYESLAEFLGELQERYDILNSFGGEQSDSARIWHCLNMLEEADPHWENRLHAFRNRRTPKTKDKRRLEKVEWELIQNWDVFAQQMIHRGGNMPFRPPAEEKETKAEPQTAKEPVEKQTAVDEQTSLQSLEKQPVEKQPVEKQLLIRLAPEATTSQPLATKTTETTGVINNVDNSTPEGSARQEIVQDTTTKDTVVKDTIAEDTTVKGKPFKSANLESLQGANDTAKQARFAIKDDTHKNNGSNNTKRNGKKLGDDEDYDDCGDHDSPEGGYADDVNYEDVDNGDHDDRDEKDVVHVNGEVRYRIPGYASRKKPRHTLVSAPRFVIANFFRQKFPGRPRCPDCRCQHPVERYMICDFCDFCHVGGDAECYHQHPELRGTRPAKDKYRRPSSPESELEVVFESDSESDSDTITGANDNKDTVDGLTNSLGTLSFIEKDEIPQEDTVKLSLPTALTTVQEPIVVAETSRNIEPPVRTKVDEGSKKAQEVGPSTLAKQDGQSSQKATEGVPHGTEKPESTSTSVPATDFVLAPAPAISPPMVDNQALLSTSSAQPPSKTAALKIDSVDDAGGAPLSAENLSRVPHDQTHRRWASMSSLTTSSSGASLIAFRRRRTNEVMKKAAAKEGVDKVAAEKAAAERAAQEAVAKGAAAKQKTAREAANKARQFARDEAARIATREAERQAQIARDRIAKEARLAAKEEQRVAAKRAKNARKREERRERKKQEREENERKKQDREEERIQKTLEQVREEDAKKELESIQTLECSIREYLEERGIISIWS